MWKTILTAAIAVGSYLLYQSSEPIPTNNTKENNQNEVHSTIKKPNDDLPERKENLDPPVHNNDFNNNNKNNSNNNDNNKYYYDNYNNIVEEVEEILWNEPKEKEAVWNERTIVRNGIYIGRNSRFEQYKLGESSDDLMRSIEHAIENNFESATFECKMKYFTSKNYDSLFSPCFSWNKVSFDFHGMDKVTTEIILDELIPLLKVHELRLCLITGQGNHSAGRIPILKEFVKNYLEERSIPFGRDSGSFYVDTKSLTFDPITSSGNITFRFEKNKKKRK